MHCFPVRQVLGQGMCSVNLSVRHHLVAWTVFLGGATVVMAYLFNIFNALQVNNGVQP